MEKGQIRLGHVQARLAQCFYLLAQSRLNHCWTLFGMTSHLVMALGIHRKARIDPDTSRNRLDYIDLECGKRTFWCAYNLNTYLSAALGRPMTFHDGDIDQELPLCIDDDQLRPGPTAPSVVVGPSLLSATIAQVKYVSSGTFFFLAPKRLGVNTQDQTVKNTRASFASPVWRPASLDRGLFYTGSRLHTRPVTMAARHLVLS